MFCETFKQKHYEIAGQATVICLP